MEIRNTLTVTRGKGEGDNRGKKGKGHQGTCIKDPGTKTMGERIECGRQGLVGWGRVMGLEMGTM